MKVGLRGNTLQVIDGTFEFEGVEGSWIYMIPAWEDRWKVSFQVYKDMSKEELNKLKENKDLIMEEIKEFLKNKGLLSIF